MTRLSYIWFFAFAFICIGSLDSHGQNQTILDFEVKEMEGNVTPFRDVLDPNTNYLIETMAFWCIPCRRSMDEFAYHKQYWKDRFNVEILLIEDEHFDDLEYVRLALERNDWDLNIVISDGQFLASGITSIPRYFFKSTEADTLERVYGFKEHLFLERLDSIFYSPLLTKQFEQSIFKSGCEIELLEFNNVDTLIDNQIYQIVNDLLLREDDQNGNLLRYNISKQLEEIHIKYSAPLCRRLWMYDSEYDSIEVKIMNRYQADGRLHLKTNQPIINTCTEDTIPFTYIQGLGTNAGLDFDIEDGRIVSQLICQREDGQVTYTDPSLEQYCELTDLEDQDLLILSIYPNPSQNYLMINQKNTQSATINVYTSDGRLLLQKKTSTIITTLDISVLPPHAVYLVELINTKGRHVEKIVKI